MICRKCNFILQGSEKFCPECGAPSSEKQGVEKTQESSQNVSPSILYASEKDEPPSSSIFRDAPTDEDDAKEMSERKSSRFPLFLCSVFLLIVIIAAGFLFVDYFELAPVIASYIETASDKNKTESTTAAPSESTTLSYDEAYGTVSPDLNFSLTLCYVATDKALPLRKGPDDSYALISYLQPGYQLQVTGGSELHNKWVYVYVPFTDVYGWVNSSFLASATLYEEASTEKIAETEEADETLPVNNDTESYTATVISESGLKLREGPGTEYDVIVMASYDDTVIVMDDTQEEWFFVYYDGHNGYMDSSYLEAE